jgi:hypothetical protein
MASASASASSSTSSSGGKHSFGRKKEQKKEKTTPIEGVAVALEHGEQIFYKFGGKMTRGIVSKDEQGCDDDAHGDIDMQERRIWFNERGFSHKLPEELNDKAKDEGESAMGMGMGLANDKISAGDKKRKRVLLDHGGVAADGTGSGAFSLHSFVSGLNGSGKEGLSTTSGQRDYLADLGGAIATRLANPSAPARADWRYFFYEPWSVPRIAPKGFAVRLAEGDTVLRSGARLPGTTWEPGEEEDIERDRIQADALQLRVRLLKKVMPKQHVEQSTQQVLIQSNIPGGI